MTVTELLDRYKSVHHPDTMNETYAWDIHRVQDAILLVEDDPNKLFDKLAETDAMLAEAEGLRM